MARISLDPPRTLVYRLLAWYSRRKFGAVLDPGRAIAHNRRVLLSYLRQERSVARWRTAPTDLKHLAVLAAAARVGCGWCLDFGYWEGLHLGIDPAKVRAIGSWSDNEVYTTLERRVLAYAEAMTATPVAVTDEQVAELRSDLTEAQLVELTMMIAMENLRGRFNSALGLASQGFRADCEYWR